MSYTDQKLNKVAVSNSANKVQVNSVEETNKSLKKRLGKGFRVDEDGIANNYPIETKISQAEYPSPKQQQRYIFLGIVATLFTAATIWIAFVVS